MLAGLRRSAAAMRCEDAWKRFRRARRHAGADRRPGKCPICTAGDGFVLTDGGPRERLVCLGCGSVPRQRALVSTLLAERELASTAVHESSPSLCTFLFLRRHAATFVASYYWPQREPGARVGAFRNVDLRAQPFAAGTFDLVITQDVLEHVPDPEVALRETQRTLRPGGSHVFTVPRVAGRPTTMRARMVDGKIEHSLPPQHHFDPIDRRGSLVFTDWGDDLEAKVAAAIEGRCEARRVHDEHRGVPDAVEVFVAQRGSRD